MGIKNRNITVVSTLRGTYKCDVDCFLNEIRDEESAFVCTECIAFDGVWNE